MTHLDDHAVLVLSQASKRSACGIPADDLPPRSSCRADLKSKTQSLGREGYAPIRLCSNVFDACLGVQFTSQAGTFGFSRSPPTVISQMHASGVITEIHLNQPRFVPGVCPDVLQLWFDLYIKHAAVVLSIGTV